MLDFKKAPGEEYSAGLSALTPELFDLMVATVNLMESNGESGRSLLDLTLDDRVSSQEILASLVSALEELEYKNIFEAPFVFPGGVCNGISIIPFC